MSHPFAPPRISGQGLVITIDWDYPENANRAVLDAMTQDFNWFPIQTLDSKSERMVRITGFDVADAYIQFRLRYFMDDIFIGETQPVWNPYAVHGIHHIELAACESYNGIAISFRDHTIYDRYCLYEMTDQGVILAAETEDFLVSSKSFQEHQTYYVEAWKKDKKTEKWMLSGRSDLWSLVISNPIRNKPVVSVVIPVYNIRHLISRTLDALVLQSLSDIEVIAVNDVCTDNTPDILAWYENRYPFIKVITHTENLYVSGSRNDGIAHASADLIAVHDNDDMMHFDMLRMLRNAILETDADIAVCRTVEHTDFGEISVILDRKPDNEAPVETFTYQEMINLRRKTGNIYFVAVWNKLCKRSILEKIYYPDNEHGYFHQKYEDSAYTAALYSHADKLAMVHDTWYVWEKRLRQTTGSLTMTGKKMHHMTSEQIWDHYMVANLLFPLRLGSEKNKDLLQYTQVKEVLIRYDRCRCWENKSNVQKTIIKRLQEGIEEFSLLSNPLIQKDVKMLTKLLFIRSLS